MANNYGVTLPEIMKKALGQTDIWLAVAVITIVMVMIIPVPPFFLDILLTLSITLSVIVLLVSLYIIKPLEFSSFPSILLFTTIFRLSLNIAGTRLILLKGYSSDSAAGHVIKSFGEFVVGGQFTVGLVIFLILVLINFMVITKGSGRVAEVAARFTLDAMPGKQMSIDADLNAGVINEDEARSRREEVRREADFYGSMDGASKFIRGDAIAGLMITGINIVGGLLIGVIQHNMDIVSAAKRYTLLTVGDGLVGQIPALLVSTAAGIVVTRAGSSEMLSKQLISQLFPQVKILFISSALLLFFAILPGMPKIPFLLVSSILFISGYLMRQEKKKDADIQEESAKAEPEPLPPKTEEEEVKDLLVMDTLELEIGFSLIPLAGEQQGGTLLSRIKSIRRQLALDMGFIVPPVRIRDNLQLDTYSYNILLRGVRAAGGSVYPDKLMVMNPAGTLDSISGIDAVEPAFNLPAKWIDPHNKDSAEMEGYTIIEPSTVISTHLSEVIKSRSYELVGRVEVQELLNKLSERSPQLVSDLIPSILDLGIVTRVLQNLLREKISIRNLQSILENLATYGVLNKDADYLTERVRLGLARQISDNLLATDSNLHIFTLPSDIEQLLAKSVRRIDDLPEIILDPLLAKKILSSLIEKCDDVARQGLSPILVVSPPIRSAIYHFVEKYIANITVISHSEIADNVRIRSLGAVEINLNEVASV